MDTVQCSGPTCRAEIIFATNTKSGKHVPLDAKPERRYVFIDGAHVRYVKTYTAHHATCPDVERFRKPHHGGDRAR